MGSKNNQKNRIFLPYHHALAIFCDFFLLYFEKTAWHMIFQNQKKKRRSPNRHTRDFAVHFVLFIEQIA